MLLLPIVAASALSVALNDMNTATRLQRAYSNQGDQGSVLFEAWIAPSGQVMECEVLETRGSAELGSTFCPIYLQHRITPAKDTEGNRAYGLIRSIIVLSNGRREALEIPADVTLTVGTLPGRDPEYRLYANLLVDEQGAVQTCEVKRKAAATYTELLCAEATAHPMAVRYDASGQAVRYVTGFWASFKKDDSKAMME